MIFARLALKSIRPSKIGRGGISYVFSEFDRHSVVDRKQSIVTNRGATVGNPAGDRRKKTEKRRAKFELRLGGGAMAYLPKDVRTQALAAEAAILKAAEEKQK